MTGSNFASLVRSYTRTNSTTLLDATIVLLANTVKDDFAREIIKADEDIFGVPVTTNLRASSPSDINQREYALPTDNMKIVRVEAKLDGTSWVKLERFDPAIYPRPLTDTEVTNSFANENNKAFWDKFRNSLWIYAGAITATTAGLKMWHIAYPSNIDATDLADTSADLSEDPSATTSSLPRQFHELWARKISIIWKSSREKPIPLSEIELVFDKDFKKAMASIDSIDEGGLVGTLPDDSHLQY